MAASKSMRIAFAGTPEFAAVALRALIDSEHEVVVALTQPDRPKGRGRQAQASAVKQTAEAAGIPVWQPENLKGEDTHQQLASYNVDVMVVVAYGLLLPEAVLSIPAKGCLNIHASLLPRWRGAAPIQRAILAGDKETGVCIMQMDAGLDTGDVLIRRELPIGVNTTSEELHDQLAQLGGDALLETLAGLSDGTVTPTPQPEAGVNYAHKLVKAEATLDFTNSATQLHQQVMAFNPWPVAQVNYDGQQLRVWRSEIAAELSSMPTAAPGTVVQIDADGVLVTTGEGILRLVQLQKPGKKPAAAADVARGMDLMDKVLG